MSENETEPQVIGAHLFTTNDGTTSLSVAECRVCGSRWFPAVRTCANCGSTDLTTVATSDKGVAYASTVVRVGAEPFTKEYVLSYVDLDGIRFLAHTQSSDALDPDTRVQLVTGQVGEIESRPVVTYMVRPTEEREPSID